MSSSSSSSAASASASLLPIVLAGHTHPHRLDGPETLADYVPFHLHLNPPTAQIGFLPSGVVAAIEAYSQSHPDVFDIQRPGSDAATQGTARIGLHRSLDTFATRSAAMAAVAAEWRHAGLFRSLLDGWRDERYAIYSSDTFPYRSWQLGAGATAKTGPNPPAFELERAACGLFGLVTFGTHITAYTLDDEKDGPGAGSPSSLRSRLKIWTPRRAAHKATWPGYLDNSVAGGITSGDSPRETAVRECWEEAGLTAELVEASLRQVGVLTYVYRHSGGTDEDNASQWLQPEVEHVYDLPLSRDVVPKPIDGEAQDFQLMGVDEVLERMHRGEFKSNCALVIIDFLIRHGVVTPENEPRYTEIVSLLHNDLNMPGP